MGKEKENNKKRSILEIIGVAVALLSVVVASYSAFISANQLKSMSETSRADFILRFENNFFKEDVMILFELFGRGWIDYEVTKKFHYIYFKVNEKEINESELSDEIKNKLLTIKTYSISDVSNSLLGQFENIGFLEKNKLLSIEMIYEMFGFHIITVWENKEIKKHIKRERCWDKDAWCNFEYIYKKCKAIQKK